jgi:hypothetical protein
MPVGDDCAGKNGGNPASLVFCDFTLRGMTHLMKQYVAVGLTSCLLLSPAYASLKPGAQAPDFTTQATLAGKPFQFALAEALKSGPVVLYFYPAAFTHGCTIEAHEFAEATEKFKALGATVIGVSHDSIDTLNHYCPTRFIANSTGYRRAA